MLPELDLRGADERAQAAVGAVMDAGGLIFSMSCARAALKTRFGISSTGQMSMQAPHCTQARSSPLLLVVTSPSNELFMKPDSHVRSSENF